MTYLQVDKYGCIDPDDVRKAITDKTILISIMYANNEIGTIHPLREIGKLAKEKGIIFHSDATQGVGKIPVDVGVDGYRPDVVHRPQDLRAEGLRRRCTCAPRDRACA